MSTIRTNTLLAADGTSTTEPSIPALDQRMATAWVNFNGTGTVAIRDSYNVSSITDNGTGDYNMNFTTAMDNSNYAIATATRDVNWFGVVPTGPTTSLVNVKNYNNGAAAADCATLNVTILGGQA